MRRTFGDVKIDRNVLQICRDNYQPAATAKPFDTKKWYHVAAVWNANSKEWNIYIDGQFAAGTATQGETMDLTSNDGYGFGIGALSQWQSSRPLMGLYGRGASLEPCPEPVRDRQTT